MKRRLLNTDTSSIGWSMRRSHQTKPASSSAARAKATMLVGDVQPCSGPWITAHTSVVMPAIDSAVPSGSKRRIVVSRDVGHEQGDGDESDGDHGHVDHQHRAPPEVLEQPPAGHRAEGDGDAGRGGPDGDRRGPLLGGGEDVDEDRQRGGEHQRRADAHRRPPADQLAGAVGQGGERREQGEQGEADLHHALAADAVAEAAGGHQQAGEDEDVGVDDPLQLAGRGTELGRQRRQGDVDDRAVEDDDEHGRAEHGEDQPAAGGGDRH